MESYIETTSTTFPYSTTTTTTEPPLYLEVVNWKWKTDHEYDHYIYLSKDGLTGQGYFDLTSSESGISVNMETITDGYCKMRVHTPAVIQGSLTLSYYFYVNSVQTKEIMYNITLSSVVDEDPADIRLLGNSPLSVGWKSSSKMLEYTAYNINPDYTHLESDHSFVNITRNPSYPIYTMSFQGNSLNTIRTALVSMSVIPETYAEDPDNYITVSLPITQAGMDGTVVEESYFEVYPLNYGCDWREQSFTVTYSSSNVSIIAPESFASWLTFNWVRGNTYRINVAQNPSEPRSGFVRFTGTGRDGVAHVQNVVVSQSAPVVDGDIEINQFLTVGYDAGTYTLPYTADNCDLETIAVTTDSNWLIPTIDSSSLTIQVFDNDMAETKSGNILIGVLTEGGGTLYKTVTVMQDAPPDFEEFPIWKDTDYIINTTLKSVNYRLITDGEVIYNGRAFAIDGKITLRVNDILKDYLNESLNLNETGIQSNSGYKSFTLQLTDDGVNYYDQYVFRVYNNWSYSDAEPEGAVISDVLTHTLDPRQMFILSFIDKIGSPQTKVNVSGARSTSTRPFSIDYTLNNDIASVVLKAGNFSNLYVDVNESDDPEGWFMEDTCKPYAIYWRNVYGGYNFYLLNKTSKETDNISSYDITTRSNNKEIGWEKRQYLKDITETWQVKTDILDDRESDIIAGIAHSPEVYLHLLDDDRIVPVNVTDTRVERKQWRNNQRKFITYTFNLESTLTKKIK